MAQLGNTLRITFTEARIEKVGGFRPFQRKVQDQSVWLNWRAETRRREGADWLQEVVAEGQITGAEVHFWADWFSNAAKITGFPDQLGDAPTIPVARLWTPLAGAAVEFFLWPDPTGSLVLMALFTPDEARPHARIAVEATLPADELQAFGTALVEEYEAMKATARPAPEG